MAVEEPFIYKNFYMIFYMSKCRCLLNMGKPSLLQSNMSKEVQVEVLEAVNQRCIHAHILPTIVCFLNFAT